MFFSTRALGVLKSCARVGKKASVFQLKKQRYWIEKATLFFALFRTTQKVRPNTFEYQLVATAISVPCFLVKNKGILACFFASN